MAETGILLGSKPLTLLLTKLILSGTTCVFFGCVGHVQCNIAQQLSPCHDTVTVATSLGQHAALELPTGLNGSLATAKLIYYREAL